MMVHESTSNRPELSAAALQALESAMRDYATTGMTPSSLEPALAQLAAEAREKKIRAEHLLIALKDVWFALPAVERARSPEEQNSILQRIVTLSVRAYYSQG
jgi:hypothetical protein